MGNYALGRLDSLYGLPGQKGSLSLSLTADRPRILPSAFSSSQGVVQLGDSTGHQLNSGCLAPAGLTGTSAAECTKWLRCQGGGAADRGAACALARGGGGCLLFVPIFRPPRLARSEAEDEMRRLEWRRRSPARWSPHRLARGFFLFLFFIKDCFSQDHRRRGKRTGIKGGKKDSGGSSRRRKGSRLQRWAVRRDSGADQ